MSEKKLENLTDELIDNIINTPDAEILDEVKEEYGDPAYQAKRVRELLELSKKKIKPS